MQKSNYRFGFFEIKLLVVCFIILAYNVFSFSLLLRGTTIDSLNAVSFVAVLISSILLVSAICAYYYRQKWLMVLANNLSTLEKQLADSKDQKKEIAHAVSGELLASFRLVQGYASMLASGIFGPIDPEVNNAIVKILRSGERIGYFIEGLFRDSTMVINGNILPISLDSAENEIVRANIFSDYKSVVAILLFTFAFFALFIQMLFATTSLYILAKSFVALVIILGIFFVVKETRYLKHSKVLSEEIASYSQILFKQLALLKDENKSAFLWASMELPGVATEIKKQVTSLEQNTSPEFIGEAKSAIIEISEAAEKLINAASSVADAFKISK